MSQGEVLQPGEKIVADRHSNLRIRVAKLESVIERLAKTNPERTAALLAGQQDPDVAQEGARAKTPPYVQAGLRELDELDIQSQIRSPLFALFNNEVVSYAWDHLPSLLAYTKRTSSNPVDYDLSSTVSHLSHKDILLTPNSSLEAMEILVDIPHRTQPVSSVSALPT